MNGNIVQKSNTSDLIFDISAIISYLSEIVFKSRTQFDWDASGVGIASENFFRTEMC